MIDITLKTKLYIRTLLFIIAVTLFCLNSTLLDAFLNWGYGGIKVYHVLWAYGMYEILLKIIPAFSHHIPSGKLFAKHYQPTSLWGPEKLTHYTHRANRDFAKFLCFWLGCSIFFYMVLHKFIPSPYIFLFITLFYYMCDMICVNVFCIFQAFIMYNRCCTTCRAYNWDQFMYCMPLLFIPSFYTYSLALLALFAALQWEYLHFKYPERFSALFNEKLSCKHCKERRCKHKLKFPHSKDSLRY